MADITLRVMPGLKHVVLAERPAQATQILFGASMTVLLGCCGCTGAEPTPGISVGADAFESTQVSPLVGWVQSGVYDAKEGLEIAVLDYGRITFLDPKTYEAKRTVEVHDDRVGFKQLVSLRADGKLNLIAGGGGFSDVGFFDLEGNSLWQFKVHKLLPPTKRLSEKKVFYINDLRIR